MRLGLLIRKVDGGERTASDSPAGYKGFFDAGEGARVGTPEQVGVGVGLDVGKESHSADVPDTTGNGCSRGRSRTTRVILKPCSTISNQPRRA